MLSKPHDMAPEGGVRFWLARCEPSTEALMLAGLVLALLLQTILVYTDAQGTVQISDRPLAGRRLWHQHNCQACNQLHGFGGFLGPDLTKAAARMDRSQLDALMTDGQGLMPAFNMNPDEIDAVWAFLTAMNETGSGQARRPTPEPAADGAPANGLTQLITESGSDAAALGFNLFQAHACTACHVLLAESATGAPDLSLSVSTLTDDEITNVLTNGRPPFMSPPAFSPEERTQLLAFIRFLAEHREEAMATQCIRISS